MFARKGWWVNFEVPIRKGRIDFLVKRSIADPWRVIEVKLQDNPDAVEQLHTYIKDIKRDVRDHKEHSYFWPLWNGRRRCKILKGVVLCAYPGKDTLKEVKHRHYGYAIWTHEYRSKDNKLRLIIRDEQGKIILGT